MKCMYCTNEIHPERHEAGYDYCMDSTCIAQGLRERQSRLRLILMPKQGFTYVFSDSDDLLHGKSSGR